MFYVETKVNASYQYYYKEFSENINSNFAEIHVLYNKSINTNPWGEFV